MEQGDAGTDMYMIMNGEVEVLQNSARCKTNLEGRIGGRRPPRHQLA